MAEEEYLDFEKICRLCMCEKESLTDIFTFESAVSIVDMIKVCASLSLYEEDGLPRRICDDCYHGINEFYLFRGRCEESDSRLRQYLQRVSEQKLKIDFVCSEAAAAEVNAQVYETLADPLEQTEENCVPDFKRPTKIKMEVLDIEDVKVNVTLAEKNIEQLKALVPSGITISKISKNLTLDTLSPPKNNFKATRKEIITNQAADIKQVEEKKLKGARSRVRCPICLHWLLHSSFASHMKNAHKGPKRGSNLEEALREYAEDTGDKYVRCKPCNLILLKTSFLNHVKYVHKNMKNHLCPHCGYRAATNYIIREHIAGVHWNSKVPCPLCDKEFSCRRALTIHKRKAHSQERKVFICDLCGKKLKTKATFKTHFLIHTNESPYECQFCKRRFKGRFAWKSHENLHTGTKPYKCTECDMAFTQNVVRKHHEFKVHGNEEFNPKYRKKKCEET